MHIQLSAPNSAFPILVIIYVSYIPNKFINILLNTSPWDREGCEHKNDILFCSSRQPDGILEQSKRFTYISIILRWVLLRCSQSSIKWECLIV